MQCKEEAFLIVFSLSSLWSLSMSSIAPYALGQSVNNVVEIIPNNAIETVLDKSAVYSWTECLMEL